MVRRTTPPANFAPKSVADVVRWEAESRRAYAAKLYPPAVEELMWARLELAASAFGLQGGYYEDDLQGLAAFYHSSDRNTDAVVLYKKLIEVRTKRPASWDTIASAHDQLASVYDDMERTADAARERAAAEAVRKRGLSGG